MPITINGKAPGVNEDVVIIQRPTGDYTLYFRAIEDYSEFDILCHPPVPPTVNYADGSKGQNLEDKNYKLAIIQRDTKRIDWMFLKTIGVTPGLQWERVKIEDPNTWGQAQAELKESGLNQLEINRIWRTFLEVNALSNAKLDEARESFLQQKNKPAMVESSPTGGP